MTYVLSQIAERDIDEIVTTSPKKIQKQHTTLLIRYMKPLENLPKILLWDIFVKT